MNCGAGVAVTRFCVVLSFWWRYGSGESRWSRCGSVGSVVCGGSGGLRVCVCCSCCGGSGCCSGGTCAKEKRGENSGGEFVGLRLLLLVLVLGAVGVDGLFVLARSAN